jgi:hypothetical protein
MAAAAMLLAAPAYSQQTVETISINPYNPPTPGGGFLSWAYDLTYGTSGLISVRWNTTAAPSNFMVSAVGDLNWTYFDPDPNNFPFSGGSPFTDYSITPRSNGFDLYYSMIYPQQPYPGAPGLWYQPSFVYMASDVDWLANAPSHAAAYITIDQAPVPEPAVWGMMIGGFGLAGVSLRYRRTRALAPA